jgi:metal-sulfur cluster biosynthetic enzyme
MIDDDRITVEELGGAPPAPPRARVEDAGAAAADPRPRDYLSGFLNQEPATVPAGEPGGEVYERVIEALKEIFDPEIPVNIYDLGLIYGVDVTADGHVAVAMTLTTPHCPVAESMPARSSCASARCPASARPRSTSSGIRPGTRQRCPTMPSSNWGCCKMATIARPRPAALILTPRGRRGSPT